MFSYDFDKNIILITSYLGISTKKRPQTRGLRLRRTISNVKNHLGPKHARNHEICKYVGNKSSAVT